MSIQIPELEETRVAHGVSIGYEITHAVCNQYPKDVEKLVSDWFFQLNLRQNTKYNDKNRMIPTLQFVL